jgi:hypothetical protein
MLNAPASLDNEQIALWEALATRLVTLDELVWEGVANGPAVENWLKNFDGTTGATPDVERLHALYLLSQFMYFGAGEIRVLLKALYRDLFLLPLAQKVRMQTTGEAEFVKQMSEEKDATRFLGVGNPSESGVHLLYYFRQENGLSKSAFLDSAQIYKIADDNAGRKRIPRYENVKRYVFLDDMCGSGETAVRYSQDLLPELTAERPDTELFYLSLFASKEGLDRIRRETMFGEQCGAVYELDESYKWSDCNSRYLSNLPEGLDSKLLISLAVVYGAAIMPGHPLGYLGGQLLLGFFHNTPDNTLPVIWCDAANGSRIPWYPIFRRYPKV